MDRVVFRLRQLPQDADRLDVVQLLSKALDIESSAIHISSLARSTDPWVASKIATLQFNETVAIQGVLKRNAKGNITTSGDEWKVRVENLNYSLVLDSHFRGLTPLYDPAIHDADCVAISGLSSHPFGSWQPKGASKSFMWIRDALPKSLPNIRPILYGYDTTLSNSNSFQSIMDLAVSLLSHIKANGWNSPTSKPLMFLAHSLGGIVLKQALVSLANQLRGDDLLRKAIKGAVFFGVPNLGMVQSHLMAMVDGQPNETIVYDLSVNSKYLCQLDRQFAGISFLQSVQLYWAYETRKSPTVIRSANGAWARTGPEEILVTQHSAARGLYQMHAKSDSTFPINENHSNMVKFAENDPDYNIVVDKLVQIVARTKSDLTIRNELSISTTKSRKKGSKITISDIIDFLDAPEKDERLEQIENGFLNTFDWVYDLQEPGFSKWLQSGAGLFWINGKPGSGKSTLMKFIFKDIRTQDLLRDWKTSAVQICAAFFFHYRGDAAQKSFEGLLRSVLTQIAKQCSSLFSHLLVRFGDELKEKKTEFWTLSRLQREFFQIMKQDHVPLHLCLFLDALDEYDGRLEPICKFLSDIGRIPQTATKRIQICFSSRPWEIFVGEFVDCPGFRIQDFTRGDIRDFCLGSIANEHLSATKLEDLVPDLVERAKGVFLWVKLVVRDLAQAYRIDTDNHELEKLLRALPTELDDYYAEVIERIPHTYRYKAYTMLEILVRSVAPLTPEQLVYALRSAASKSFAECYAAHIEISRHEDLGPELDFVGLVEQFSRTYCGGLIEVVSGSDTGYRQIVQVIHQTVEDFVIRPNFKPLILGGLARITTENGYSYLAKCYFGELFSRAKSSFDWPFLYARAAEDSTGRSMKYFWDSVPPQLWLFFNVQTSLGFAAISALRLFLRDILAEDPNALRRSTELLITAMVRSPVEGPNVAMTKFLLDGGFSIDQDPLAYREIIYRIKSSGPPAEQKNTLFEIAQVLVENGQSANSDFAMEYITCKPLHMRPLSLSLAEALLEYGAYVNAMDSVGNTPLDYQFATIDDSAKSAPITEFEFYQLTCLLVSRGGTTSKTRRRTIQARLEGYSGKGWETHDLHRALLPTPALFSNSLKSRFGKYLRH